MIICGIGEDLNQGADVVRADAVMADRVVVNGIIAEELDVGFKEDLGCCAKLHSVENLRER